jgi:acyl-coenzyme A thioesterase PaaI-like protein
MSTAFQDLYPEAYSHCFGCGRSNPSGLRIKSRWEGDEVVAVHYPEPHHIGFPGFVYGGLLASLVDCHAIAAASADAHRTRGLDTDQELSLGYVTASLTVDYLKPTPMGPPIELRARIDQTGPRKTVVSVTVTVEGVLCARGLVVAVAIPGTMVPANREP